MSLAGMLYLRMAMAAARRADRAATGELLAKAADAARRLGRDQNLWHTGFGPTNVILHRFSAALDMGDVAFVVDKGPDVTVDHMSPERRVSFRIDLARGFSLAGRDTAAVEQLREAETVAPALVRHSVVARETVRELHRRDRGRTSGLGALAQRCRAIP